MEEQEGEISSPFWVQNSATRHHNRRRHSSLFLNSGVLLFTLCITLALFVFFVLPTILSITPQIFRPKSLVKKSWDSINFVLVLFALVFGFLSRNRNHDSSFESFDGAETSKNRNEVQKSMYEHSDRTGVVGLRRTYSSYPDLREISMREDTGDPWRFYDDTSLDPYWRQPNKNIYTPPVQSPVKIVNTSTERQNSDRPASVGLRRTYSSYPDLREITPPEDTVDWRRSYDDASLDAYRANEVFRNPPVQSPVKIVHSSINLIKREGSSVTATEKIAQEPTSEARSDHVTKALARPIHRRGKISGFESPLIESQHSVPAEHFDWESNNILAEERVIRQVGQDRAPLQVGSPMQLPAVRQRTRRTAESTENKGRSDKHVNGSEASQQFNNRKTKRTDEKEEQMAFEEYYKLSPPSKSERKRGGGNVTRQFLDSFRKKKKKQRQKSIENFETLLGSQPWAPPPPPPPPPPPSVVQNFFSSKKGKSKKILTVPPPPPPPPPYFTATRAQKSTPVIAPTTVSRPPLPVKIQSLVQEASNSSGESPLAGAESPLHPIPPPPPLPPFKMPSWKFVVKGDYVKIGSMNSSRSVSPDPDEVDSPTSSETGGTPNAVDDGEAAVGAMFCPSPDVNSKADMFIAKFRAGLKLQKLNSMNQKQGVGLSNLGPTKNLDQSQT